MAPDGDLSVGATYFQNNQRYNLGFQALPWLEADIRYSGLDHFLFEPEFPVYWDRSFAMKARLWQEGDLLPSVAVGINDLIGTGIYSGEYLVGSKQFGSLDVSLGIGWGRLGSTDQFKNPLASLFPSFGRPRTSDLLGTAGGTNFNVFFHGPDASLFGGVVWQTPVKNLSLIAEYSSDAYSLESQTGNFDPRNQMNYGASYRVSDTVALSLEWLYGRSIGGNISFDMDPTRDASPQHIGSALPPAPPVRSAKQQQDALELMLGQRKGIFTAPEKFSSTEKLADVLWQENSDLVDVTVQGRRLSLTVVRGDLGRMCRAAAQTAGLYSLTITAVSVSNASAQLSCSVTAMPALAILAPTLDSRLRATTLAQPMVPASFITIDAMIEPEPDAKAAIAHIRADADKQRITIDAIDISGGEADRLLHQLHLLFRKRPCAYDQLGPAADDRRAVAD